MLFFHYIVKRPRRIQSANYLFYLILLLHCPRKHYHPTSTPRFFIIRLNFMLVSSSSLKLSMSTISPPWRVFAFFLCSLYDILNALICHRQWRQFTSTMTHLGLHILRVLFIELEILLGFFLVFFFFLRLTCEKKTTAKTADPMYAT